MKVMKVWLVTLCGVTVLSACGGGTVKKEKKSDLAEMFMNGKVKELTEHTEGATSSQTYKFNESGYITEVSQTDVRSNKNTVLVKNEYDEKGKLVATCFYNSMDGSLQRKQAFNADGNITEELDFSRNYSGEGGEFIVSGRRLYKYDETGLLISSWSENNEQNRSEYECDAAGNTLKRTDYYQNEPSLILSNSYKYDSDGNITEEVKYFQELPKRKDKDLKAGEIEQKTVRKFNGKGQQTEETIYYYEFDTKQKKSVPLRRQTLTCDYTDFDAILKSVYTTYKYKDGEEEKVSEKIIDCVYLLDDHNNWTSMDNQMDNETVNTVNRTITYYE